MTPMEKALEAYDALYGREGPTNAVKGACLAYVKALPEDAETVERVARAARAIEATMFAPHELPTSAELHQKYLGTTRAALLTLSTIGKGK